MNEKNKEILKLTGNMPWITHPHTLAMKIDPSWKPFEFLVETSNILAQSISAGNARIIICFHPRIGKTTLAVLYLIIWFLNLWPNKTVILATYSESFAEERARLVRNTIQDNQNCLTVRLAPDSQSSSRFHTFKNGGLISLGLSSGISGLPCDALIIDDIFSSFSKAQNPKERRKVIQWFQDSYMRLQPGGSVIIIGARTHPLDLQGFLLAEHSDRWNLISYPAISKGKEIDPLKRPADSALCPELYDSDALSKIEASIGPKKWHAQYQQSPIPEEEEDGATLVFPPELLSKIGSSFIFPFEDRDHYSIPSNGIHYIGIDPGKKNSNFGVVICQKFTGNNPHDFELHIIFLKRYDLGTKIHKVIEELDALSRDERFGDLAPIFVMDRSGFGGELCLEIMHERQMTPIIPVTVLSRGNASNKLKILKHDLIENLTYIISESRLKVPQGLPNAEILFEELTSYHAELSPKGQSTTYRSHGGATDDLLDALSLVAYAARKQWEPLWSREPVGLTPESARRRPISGNRGEFSSNLRKSLYAQTNRGYASLRGWI